MLIRPTGSPRALSRARIAVLATALGVALAAIGAQLWHLQILAGHELAALSDRNRIRVRSVTAPRGILFDRSGQPLVENRPAFTLAVVPREADDLASVLRRLAVLLDVPPGELTERFERVAQDSPWPVRLRRSLSLDDVAKVEEWKLELPGVFIEAESQRSYPGARFAAHLLGYVREASEADVGRAGVGRGDLVGQSGLERLYDASLRGKDGSEQFEVDAHGRPVRILARTAPLAGAHVHMTLDRHVQEAAEQALGPRTGAVVVMDPRSGDVLALVSNPAYPVERLSAPLDRETWRALIADPAHPLLNRPVQGEYAPGSLFKVVVAAAALRDEVITPFDRLPCPASFTLGNRAYHNWDDRDRGALTLAEAIRVSCNTFFYQLALKLGPDRIAEMAREFGLGALPGTGLAGERAGLVPTPAWKRRVQNDRWHPGDTVSMAIGQGLVTATPLQLARLMAAVANGGTVWKPRLVTRVESARGVLEREEGPVSHGRVRLAPVILDFLREALRSAVNDEGGTGREAAVPGIAVAGKTGTAQLTEFKSESERKRRDRDHAWFAGFAPADDPRVVVVVLAERAGLGGQVAAPIARQILRAIFLDRVV